MNKNKSLLVQAFIFSARFHFFALFLFIRHFAPHLDFLKSDVEIKIEMRIFHLYPRHLKMRACGKRVEGPEHRWTL